MRDRKKTFQVLLCFFLAFIVGYFREALFLVVNGVANKNGFPYNTAYIAPPQFLYDLSGNGLLLIKWLGTLFFTLLFMLLSVGMAKVYMGNHKARTGIVVVYTALFFAALFVSVLGFVTGNFSSYYPVSRFIVGVCQSPLLVLVMFLLLYYKKTFR